MHDIGSVALQDYSLLTSQERVTDSYSAEPPCHIVSPHFDNSLLEEKSHILLLHPYRSLDLLPAEWELQALSYGVLLVMHWKKDPLSSCCTRRAV